MERNMFDIDDYEFYMQVATLEAVTAEEEAITELLAAQTPHEYRQMTGFAVD